VAIVDPAGGRSLGQGVGKRGVPEFEVVGVEAEVVGDFGIEVEFVDDGVKVDVGDVGGFVHVGSIACARAIVNR